MIEFEAHREAHILHARMKTQTQTVANDETAAAYNLEMPTLRLKHSILHTTKLEQPPDKDSKDCAHLNKLTRNNFALDTTAVPSTNCHFNTTFTSTKSQNTTTLQTPSMKEAKHTLQKYQLKLLKLSQYKQRKLPKGEALFGRHLKCLANEQITGLFTHLRSKTAMFSVHTTPHTTTAKIRKKNRMLPGLGATSIFTLITLIFLEVILLSTVSNCAKTFYMHWNTSNSIFRIDNTDHIIDVNKGNLAFEFDQVHIICPVYEPGTFENETEKYIIYNVSKVEYETCRITNADPRVIAICDKPQKLMFFTITFRPFTPQPGGLEFLPGNDYYFISTSSKDDLYRRIGGRCSTNNMKVVFKVCCAPEEKNKTITTSTTSAAEADADVPVIDTHSPVNNNQQHQQQQHNNINTFGIGSGGGVINTGININSANGHNNGIQLKPLNVGGSTGTSINTNIDQFNRIPMQTNGINVIGHNIGVGAGNGILLTPGGGNHGGINMIPAIGGGSLGPYHPGIGPYHPGQTTTGIRINNVPSQQYPSHKHNSNNNNNGKEVEEQEFVNGDGGEGGVNGVGDGNGVNIGNQLPPQFLPPIIDTNHSNIVQSTMNWPPTHWSGNSNIYYNHNTNQNIPNQNISANENHYHSPPHRPPPSTTSTNHNKNNKKDHYDKHPNEVVKNEELTYNSASTTIHRTYWSWKKLFVWEATLSASSNSLAYYAQRFGGFTAQTLSNLENILLNLLKNPLALLTILFVAVVQCVYLKSYVCCNVNTTKLSCNKVVRRKMPALNVSECYQDLR